MYCRIGTVKDHYSNYIPVIYTKKKIATYDSICHRFKNKEYLFSLEQMAGGKELCLFIQ
jgi:hypothetical protein